MARLAEAIEEPRASPRRFITYDATCFLPGRPGRLAPRCPSRHNPTLNEGVATPRHRKQALRSRLLTTANIQHTQAAAVGEHTGTILQHHRRLYICRDHRHCGTGVPVFPVLRPRP